MKIKVAVLFGGKSVEHEISVISAIQAIGYIDKEKYEVIPIYITKNNLMYIGEDIGKIESYSDVDALLKRSQQVILIYDGERTRIIRYPFKVFAKGVVDDIDVAFPIVHGTNVEDGALQGYLKTLNLPFVGCDVLASAVGMDKYVMKTVLKDKGIPVLDCLCFTDKEYDDDSEGVMTSIKEKIGFPLIVKPINLGSSIGISKAKDDDSLCDALETAFQYAQKVLVERAVQNLKEINCAVLGDEDSARASECEEPVGSDQILSFEDKYMGNGAKGAKSGGAKSSGGSKGMVSLKRKIPADITHEQRNIIQEYAVKAFRCLGCNGVSRIDFMMDTESGEIFLNEINTIPGSLSFYLWEPIGVKYTQLLDEMLMLALKRQRKQGNITYKFDSNVLEGVKFGGSKGKV